MNASRSVRGWWVLCLMAGLGAQPLFAVESGEVSRAVEVAPPKGWTPDTPLFHDESTTFSREAERGGASGSGRCPRSEASPACALSELGCDRSALRGATHAEVGAGGAFCLCQRIAERGEGGESERGQGGAGWQGFGPAKGASGRQPTLTRKHARPREDRPGSGRWPALGARALGTRCRQVGDLPHPHRCGQTRHREHRPSAGGSPG